MISSCEVMIQYLYPQFKTAVETNATDEDRYVDIDGKGNLVSVAASVNLLYIPRPSYHVDLGVAYTPLARRGGYGDFDSLPARLKIKFPVVSLSDYNLDEPERATTPFGILPRFIIGLDNIMYIWDNYYFFNALGQSVKIEEIFNASDEDETLDEALKSFGDEGDFVRVPFSPRKRGRKNWEVAVDLEGGDLEKLSFIAGELTKGNFRRVGVEDVIPFDHPIQ